MCNVKNFDFAVLLSRSEPDAQRKDCAVLLSLLESIKLSLGQYIQQGLSLIFPVHTSLVSNGGKCVIETRSKHE